MGRRYDDNDPIGNEVRINVRIEIRRFGKTLNSVNGPLACSGECTFGVDGDVYAQKPLKHYGGDIEVVDGLLKDVEREIRQSLRQSLERYA